MDAIVDLALLFGELRTMSDGGTLAYPYSTRELVKLAQHLERFPDDGIDMAYGSRGRPTPATGKFCWPLASTRCWHRLRSSGFSHMPPSAFAVNGARWRIRPCGRCANVFSFDAFDSRLRGVLASVLGRCGARRVRLSPRQSSRRTQHSTS